MTTTFTRIGILLGIALLAACSRKQTPPAVERPDVAMWKKPLAERSREEIQRQVVGTWQAGGEDGQIYGFDEQSRVAYDGLGTDVQSPDPDLLAGRVRYEVDVTPQGCLLRIVYPTQNQRANVSFRIHGLDRGELQLEYTESGKSGAPVRFVRVSDIPASIIDENTESGAAAGAETPPGR